MIKAFSTFLHSTNTMLMSLLFLLFCTGSGNVLVNADLSDWLDLVLNGGGEVPCMLGFVKGDDGYCYLVRHCNPKVMMKLSIHTPTSISLDWSGAIWWG